MPLATRPGRPEKKFEWRRSIQPIRAPRPYTGAETCPVTGCTNTTRYSRWSSRPTMCARRGSAATWMFSSGRPGQRLTHPLERLRRA